MQINKKIFRSDGVYIGFVKEGYIYSRDGIYLGWLDGKYAWDRKGFFRGVLTDIDNEKSLILLNKFSIPPTQRISKEAENIIPPPDPVPNIKPPMQLPIGIIDGFN